MIATLALQQKGLFAWSEQSAMLGVERSVLSDLLNAQRVTPSL